MRKLVVGSVAVATLAATGLVAVSGPAAAATVAACGNHSLSVSASHEQGATDYGSFVLRFKNTSRSTCSLFGYPGLDALDKNGRALPSGGLINPRR
jgi:hypothetical protein